MTTQERAILAGLTMLVACQPSGNQQLAVSSTAPATMANSLAKAAERCSRANIASRDENPQGTELWGLKERDDRQRGARDAIQPPLFSRVAAAEVWLADGSQSTAQVIDGALSLTAASRAPAPPLPGTLLKGTGGEKTSVDVAVCAMERDASDVTWYVLQYFNETKGVWQNPCPPRQDPQDATVLHPGKAVAVHGTWDDSGAYQATDKAFTFACENGVIAKCIGWGYKPWQKREGKSLQDYHLACVRMARADYCGNGRSHTAEGTTIDLYDDLGIQRRAADSGQRQSSLTFEAGWAPDGATCIERPRKTSETVDKILQECPERFLRGAARDLGAGDRCSVTRKGNPLPPALLRNRS